MALANHSRSGRSPAVERNGGPSATSVLAALGASGAVLYADAVGALGGTVAAGAVAGASLALAAAVRRSPSRAPALDFAPLAVDPDATAVVGAPRASELAPSAGHSDAA